MGKMRVITCLGLCVSVCQVAMGEKWYVDGSLPTSGNGQSWETAFQAIQEGINATSDGDSVSVAQGTYLENIRFNGKNIALLSTDPLDPEVVANTIIDGRKAGSVVIFSGTEDKTCVIAGFTVRNGEADEGGGIFGGTPGNRTHATIVNNTICGNLAWFGGGGLAGCDGTIQNNTIRANSGGFTGGGGLAGCDGTIQNNLIVGNTAGLSGGGLMSCNGEIRNNTITGNSGGGMNPVGGLVACNGTIRNCVIWGNTPMKGGQLSESSVPSYSCIQDWTGGGEGNIAENPCFVDPEKSDYRLFHSSPCIDTGENYSLAYLAMDVAGMHRIMYGGKSLTVDMGAYEYYVNDIEVDANSDITITWSSLTGKTYAIYFSSDTMAWQLAADSVPSAGDTVTTWLDPTAPLFSPGLRKRYYRVRENG